MRTGAGFNMTAAAAPAAPAMTKVSSVSHSAWHSPVPYLFGGLAAMLGLIAFALLILACSYWKLSGYLESGRNGGEGSEPEGKPATVTAVPVACYEEKVVVFMAGDDKPYLATPISSRASSFGNNSCKNGEEEEEEKNKKKAESLAITINEEESNKSQDQQSSSDQNQNQEA